MCSDRLRHVRVVLPAPLDTYINTDQLSPPPRSICKAAGRGLRGGAASAARGVRCMKHVVYHAALISHILQLMCIHAHGMPRYRRVALGESWHELVAKVFRVLTGPHWRLRVHGGPGPSDGAGACWHGEVVEIAKPLMTDQISELRARAAARLSLLAVSRSSRPDDLVCNHLPQFACRQWTFLRRLATARPRWRRATSASTWLRPRSTCRGGTCWW